ncbi:hypothetical protein D3C79_1011960 [compost metagenome]
MIEPPSATVPVAFRLRPVSSIESVMVVTAGFGFGTRFSKLPPVAPAMVVLTLLPLL